MICDTCGCYINEDEASGMKVFRCEECRPQVTLDKCRKYREDNPFIIAAHNAVTNAKSRKELPHLDGSIDCVDCGRPARHYDHRYYTKPLDVEPVCASCNVKRGSAYDLEELKRKHEENKHD